MTEFRTRGKGKERKVYPVKKRQAFGVSRNLAYDEVQALRKQGKRARLIQTNRTLDTVNSMVRELQEAGDTGYKEEVGAGEESLCPGPDEMASGENLKDCKIGRVCEQQR